MPATFVLRKRAGKFSFDLVAGNGAAIAKSVTYSSKRAAMNGIALIQTAVKAIEDKTEKPTTSVGRTVATTTTGKRAATKAPAKRAGGTTTAKKATVKPGKSKRTVKRATSKTVAKNGKAPAKQATLRRTGVKSRVAISSTRPRATAKTVGSTVKRTTTAAKRTMARSR
jgi:uncharacterized protein YegP (UPF0339 family)